ncbi:hypothetical protein DFJ74DRAFT_696620 [Hyaloraphidium curvatum]|nr:hypothetical protein DFJ74DRAFT_696620 [Hyaloraphidium curvatum]
MAWLIANTVLLGVDIATTIGYVISEQVSRNVESSSESQSDSSESEDERRKRKAQKAQAAKAPRPPAPAGPSSGGPPSAPPPVAFAPQLEKGQAPGVVRGGSADVVIIGAGISGLSAAEALRKAGFRCLLVEARERLGGRIWTDRNLGIPIDVGASFIHGASSKNPVYALATASKQPVSDKVDWDNFEAYDANTGSEVKEKLLEKAYDETVKALKKAREAAKKLSSDISIADALGRAGVKLDPLMSFYLDMEISSDYAAPLSDLSMLNFDRDDEFSGGDRILPAGYDRIAVEVAKSAQADIRYLQEVRTVRQTAAGVEVITAGGIVYSGAAAICTVPLGVLKAGTIAFEPPLPADKVQALSIMKMGVLGKMVMSWPAGSKPFWDPKLDCLSFVSGAPNVPNLWFNASKGGKFNRPVLIGFAYGSAAIAMEDTAQKTALVASIVAMFRRAYGSKIADPEAVFCTAWHDDPLSRGSYSIPAVGYTKRVNDALSAAHGRVLFAGEHTSDQYRATVHGAILEGRRAAAEVARILPRK